jgi:hypothetical protein
MHEPDALRKLDRSRVSRRAWWCLGAITYIAWAVSAVLEGGGAFTLMAMPLFVGLWVLAVLAIDRWVMRGVAGRW